MEYLELKNSISGNKDLTGFSYLQRYSNLGIIDLISNTKTFKWIYNYSITAFICTQSSGVCIFKKRTCPFGCVCTLERNKLQFNIDCDSINPLKLVPDLPIPIIGNATLYFNNKNLTELPKSTLYGYSNLRQLYVANNRLTHISLAQLPANFTYLDVSNNSLKTYDKNVLEYLSSRSGKIRLRFRAIYGYAIVLLSP